MSDDGFSIDNVPMARRPSPALPQRWIGQILKSLRLQSGMSGAAAARAAGLSPATMTRYERGERRPHPNHVTAMLEAYGQPADVTRAVRAIATAAAVTPWYASERDLSPELAMFAGLESSASGILSWQPLTVPGLLQIDAYARAIIEHGPTEVTKKQLDAAVAFRLDRQQLIADADSPEFTVVLAEAALRNPVGGVDVMREQIAHLIEVSRRPHVGLHILPTDSGAHPGMDGPFVLLDFPPAAPEVPLLYSPSTVYLQAAGGALYLDDADDVGAYRSAHERLVEMSTSGDETRELLRRLS